MKIHALATWVLAGSLLQCTQAPEKEPPGTLPTTQGTFAPYLPSIIKADIDPYRPVKGKSRAEIKDLLKDMFEADQRWRDSLHTRHQPERNAFYQNKMVATDAANRILLDRIIEEFGWPTLSAFGEEGVEAAWYILWHHRDDRTYLTKYLDQLQQAAAQKEIPYNHYLTVKEWVEWKAPQ
ncbi:hypothetical protein GCM10027275_08110 [Rhabdobacter roseus]|uniref:Uncharacterized protein n=1 Tax=Rhabdobacter roseus TaxID=1655419 RepID=A0A840THH0_9BACT|nr:DUF6624 domain-containing protein [Rhabdobacter roseus]MBB5282711.1 hypothetical protein [Rhabdobacter roseus]